MSKFRFKTAAEARKFAKKNSIPGIHSHGKGKNKVYMAGKTHAAFNKAMRNKVNRKKARAKRKLTRRRRSGRG